MAKVKSKKKIYEYYVNEFKKHRYKFMFWRKFDFTILGSVITYKKIGNTRDKSDYNEVWIMADTETSKKDYSDANHVCAWSIAFRAFDCTICTLYGRKPSELVECIETAHEQMHGDKTIIYWHNAPYDWQFTRQFCFDRWGFPSRQLNLKSHYQLTIEFDNGVIFKDSLALAQKSLEKWAHDYGVTPKAVGLWDYDKIRSQRTPLSKDELTYIECDVKSGVECLNIMAKTLNKHVCNMPLTNTGIVREAIRREGHKHSAKTWYDSMRIDLRQYLKLAELFHGGYTHANRFISNRIQYASDYGVKSGVSYDFASSYPYVLCSMAYPQSTFNPIGDKDVQYIVDYSDTYAFMFKLTMVNVSLKPNKPMPCLQYSHCETVNPILDNGRLLYADACTLYTNEVDLKVILDCYTYTYAKCTEVEFAHKKYLPRWFTDTVLRFFENKTKLKGGDPLNYMIEKGKLNSCYGLTVVKNIRAEINENYETGEFTEGITDMQEVYDKYCNNKNTILPYFVGVWCTSYAMSNLYTLAKMATHDGARGTWLYSDTDSCYFYDPDPDEVEKYNKMAIARLRANGYDGITYNGKFYCLGVAEKDENEFTEFKTMGAKKYCYKDMDGVLHMTVAGVPKKRGCATLKNDIENFKDGFIFKGTDTGKLTHSYIYENKIKHDKYGEYGDSINLTPCDYLLKHEGAIDSDFDSIFTEEVKLDVYEEN